MYWNSVSTLSHNLLHNPGVATPYHFDKMAHHILSSNTFEEAMIHVGHIADELTHLDVESFEPIFSLLVQKYHLTEVLSEYALQASEVLTMSTHFIDVA
jgi:hypothetical protein